MSGRRDYFYLQQVTDGELDSGFNELEKADRAMILALGMVGITTNLDVVQHGAGDSTVDISGLGKGHDKLGQFLNVPSNQNVDLSVDSNGQTTAISAFGLHRIVSVFLKFNRTLSDPRVDGNSDTVYFVRDESFTFLVIQGAESAGILTPPALQTDALLLADITRDFGVAAILNNHISYARREDAFGISNTPRSIRAGTASGAMTQMLQFYSNHVNGVADQHPAGSLTYLGSGPWANASTIAAGTVEATFDTMVATLASSSSGNSGAHLLGSDAIVGTANTLAAASIFTQLGRLKLASNHEYGGGGTWADGTTNPAASSEAQLDKIISDLAPTTGGASGAHRLGSAQIAGGSTYLAAGTLSSQITSLKSAANLDQPARTTWLGGRTNPATRVDLAIDKIITDLGASDASDDGAERIGFAPSGNIAATDVAAAIRFLDAEKGGLAISNTWALQQTFSGGITANGSAVVNNTLAVSGVSTFSGSAVVNNTLTVSGVSTFNGANAVNNSTTYAGSTAWQAMRGLDRRSSGASTSISIAADYVIVGSPTLPTTVDVTRPSAATAIGTMITVYAIEETVSNYVFQDNGTTMATMPPGPRSPKQWIMFVWSGTAWMVGPASSTITIAAGY